MDERKNDGPHNRVSRTNFFFNCADSNHKSRGCQKKLNRHAVIQRSDQHSSNRYPGKDKKVLKRVLYEVSSKRSSSDDIAHGNGQENTPEDILNFNAFKGECSESSEESNVSSEFLDQNLLEHKKSGEAAHRHS